MRILRQVEAGRPVVEAAQNEMLDGVEPDRAQSQGVLDSAADVGQPKVLESRKTCTYSRVPALPTRVSKSRRSRRNSSGSAHPVSGRRLIERAVLRSNKAK